MHVHDETVTQNHSIDRFPAGVAEQLGYYVYALVDPRTRQIFYIGKGKDNRVFAHARDAEVGPAEEASLKLKRIREIKNAGQEVGVYIIRHGIESERQAFNIEAAVIDAMTLGGLLSPDEFADPLTNIAGGHGSKQTGLMDIPALISTYAAEPAPDITQPSILIRVSQQWTPTIGQQDDGRQLYKVTRQWWKVGKTREKARYAFAVSNGVVRAVYAIEPNSWEGAEYNTEQDEWLIVSKEKAGRWRFSGKPAAEMHHYVGKSVARYFSKGSQNPIKYLNC